MITLLCGYIDITRDNEDVPLPAGDPHEFKVTESQFAG